jgi:hypothetical protein
MENHPAQRRLQRRDSIIAGCVVGIAFLASACSGGTAPSSVAHIGNPAPTTTVAPAAEPGASPNLQQMYEADVVYAWCMRSHGVPDFPDPTESPNGIGIRLSGIDPNSAQFRASQTACRAFSPAD